MREICIHFASFKDFEFSYITVISLYGPCSSSHVVWSTITTNIAAIVKNSSNSSKLYLENIKIKANNIHNDKSKESKKINSKKTNTAAAIARTKQQQ